MLDGGAPFYDTYACRDGKFLSVGAIEPQFYAQLLAITGAADPDLQNSGARSAGRN
jgi:alpha-methylacyl-CoA racemase